MSVVSKDTVRVTWEPPAQPSGPISSYIVLYTTVSNKSEDLWTRVEQNGSEDSAEIKIGKVSGTVLYFKLYANTETGAGKMSTVVQLDTALLKAGRLKWLYFAIYHCLNRIVLRFKFLN